MKKTLFAMVCLMALVLGSCADDVQEPSVAVDAPAAFTDGNNEGDPDGGKKLGTN